MKLLAGDVAVVTGAASGIGYALAEGLLERGLAVVLADIEPSALEDAERALTAPGRRILSVVTDVAQAGIGSSRSASDTRHREPLRHQRTGAPVVAR